MSRMRAEEPRLPGHPADSRFRLTSDFEPRGDQPRAIEELVSGLERGDKHQVLLGVTGSGKTFTIASVLARINRPALVLAHNKTLAAQLYQEFKTFFPENAVEYFVSYYDYYQPEAYVPQSDTYIEKEATINEEIDRMRLSATRSLFDPLTGKVPSRLAQVAIYPSSHYVTPRPRLTDAIRTIEAELLVEKEKLERQGKLLEAQRLYQRTMFDLEMLRETGHCHGIENYSRHLSGRAPGEPPPTLLDYLPKDALMVIDESHQSVPQVRGMYHGDRQRKSTLVEYGFRMPSALDNRPLSFEAFETRLGEVGYVSATPGPTDRRQPDGERVGINLLREGLDLPEVSLVAILDADKEGFLRSSGSLIQTMGRAARNVEGTAMLYADQRTDSMKAALEETSRRRALQEAYNREHGITPESIKKNIGELLSSIYEADYASIPEVAETPEERYRSLDELEREIKALEKQMREAAKALEFEKAAEVRDRIKALRAREFGLK